MSEAQERQEGLYGVLNGYTDEQAKRAWDWVAARKPMHFGCASVAQEWVGPSGEP